ncbi:PilZ domain-containing protein [Telmatobacter sp. DSM 110680]|uniref:PilZ domain-containing protein n=1 Tax=Telmatobacter sp. DSM 110680 TaxID=3036704 RepID=A0AAU7DJW2_9BACT
MTDRHPESDSNLNPFLPGETASAQRLPAARISRRMQQRLGVDTSVVLRLIDLAADIHGRIIDISLGGCHILTEKRFPVGIFRRVEIEFHMEGLPFRLGGVTQAVYDPFNVGLRFLDLSERKREQLQQLVDEIKATEPEPD